MEFAPWLDELFTQCRDRWGYHIPEDAGERAMLRTSCVRMLDFERHFLAIYQPYLLVELRGDLDGQLKSLEALTHAPFADTEVLASVEGLAKRQGAAPHTLAHVVATRLRALIDGRGAARTHTRRSRLFPPVAQYSRRPRQAYHATRILYHDAQPGAQPNSVSLSARADILSASRVDAPGSWCHAERGGAHA